MLDALWLLLSVPLGLFFASLTRDEKSIYLRPPYFPVLLWVFVLLSAVFFSLDTYLGSVFLFVFLTLFVWGRV